MRKSIVFGLPAGKLTRATRASLCNMAAIATVKTLMAGHTLLHRAVASHSLKAPILLLKYNADPNVPHNIYGSSPLFASLIEGRQDWPLLGLLLENGADSDAVIKYEWKSRARSPGSATGTGDSNTNYGFRSDDKVALVPVGTDSQEAEISYSPVSWAVMHDYEQPLSLMLSACENITWVECKRDGNNLLYYAVRLRIEAPNRILGILLMEGGDALRSSTNNFGETPLHTAAQAGNVGAGSMLLYFGLSISTIVITQIRRR